MKIEVYMKEYVVTEIQNLIDSGCDKQTIERFESCEDVECKLVFLEKYRKEILENIHEQYSNIDKIDFLIYKIKKESKK